MIDSFVTFTGETVLIFISLVFWIAVLYGLFIGAVSGYCLLLIFYDWIKLKLRSRNPKEPF